MPVQKTQARFSLGASLKKAAQAPVEYPQDFTRLPGGIAGGIAKLVTASIGVYKTGQYEGQKFFRAAGVVIEPSTVAEQVKEWDTTSKPPRVRIVAVNQRNVKGLQTSIMTPLCDTKNAKGEVKTADEHTQDMTNELRILAGKDFFSDAPDGMTDQQSWQYLDDKLAELVQAGPYFKFGTNTPDPTAQYQEPRTFERWYGSKGMESYEPPDMGAVVDNTEAAPATPPKASKNGTPPPDPSFDDGAQAAAATPDTDSNVTEAELTKLIKTASADVKEGTPQAKALDAATARLQEIATALGLADDFIAGADSWDDVLTGLTEAQVGNAEADAPAEDAWKVGDTCKFHAIDPTTKKPVMKSKKPVYIEGEIKAIGKDGTVTVLDYDTKRQVKTQLEKLEAV